MYVMYIRREWKCSNSFTLTQKKTLQIHCTSEHIHIYLNKQTSSSTMMSAMQTNSSCSGLSHLVEAATALSRLAELQSSYFSEATEIAHSERLVVSDDDVDESKRNTTALAAGTLKEIFPQRLMTILSDSSLSDVISWLPHGRSFVIIRPDTLAERVLKYLPSTDPRSSTKYTSFTRKLNRWGFRQETRGPDTGAFYHPLFRRDQPNWCQHMICQKPRKRPSKITQDEGMITEICTTSSLPPKEHKIQTIKHDPLTCERNRLNEYRSVCNASAVSGDDQSISSSSTSSVAASPSPIISSLNFPSYSPPVLTFTPTMPHVIVNDSKLVESSLKARDEMERLSIAKSMLYDAYMKTLNGK